MKLSAILAPLIAAKVPHDIIMQTVQAWEAEQSDALEKRREADRVRQDRKRNSDKSRDVTLRNSDSLLVRDHVAPGDVKQINLEIPKEERKDKSAAKPLSDLDGFKAEVEKILSPEQVEALVGIRRKKKAALTPYAGKLLVASLKACPDVSVAADEMVLRNWTGIKPEWLADKQTQRPQGQAPPKPRSEFMQRQHDIREQLRRENGEPDEQFAGNTIDLAERDFRHH